MSKYLVQQNVMNRPRKEVNGNTPRRNDMVNAGSMVVEGTQDEENATIVWNKMDCNIFLSLLKIRYKV